MTEYNFRHQTKMMSIELAGFGTAKHPARIYLQFAAYFVGFMHSRPALAPDRLA